MTKETLTAVIHKEEDLYVALCPEVGTASQGKIFLMYDGGPKGRNTAAQMLLFNLSWLLNGATLGDFIK